MDARHNAQTSKNASTSEGSKNSVDVVKHGQSDKDTKTHPSVQESEGEDQQDAGFECPVCLQTASFPVQLPCRHIFCFLCVKGAANRSKRCAMCRQEIPADFFNDPKLLHSEEVSEKSKTIFDEGYQWFYEGRNGWWQYDERTSLELENKYKAGERTFELLIAGFLYVIDLENMRQFRRNDQTRRRKMKRDMCDIPDIKGIAGIKYNESQHMLRPSGDGGEARKSSGNVNPIPNSTPSLTQSVSAPSVINNRGPIGGQDDSFVGPSAPNNTPQAPMTPADSQSSSLANSQEDLSLHLQNLHLFHPSVRRVRSRPESPSTAYPPPWYDEDEEDRRAPSPPPDYGRDEGLEGYSGEISADAVGEGDGTDEDTGEYSADDADNISSPNREVKETRL